jgi:hypothetical protein
MPPETRQMSPEEAQELLLGLAEEALSGRTGQVVYLEAPEWPPLSHGLTCGSVPKPSEIVRCFG